jgi:hypothetical protein
MAALGVPDSIWPVYTMGPAKLGTIIVYFCSGRVASLPSAVTVAFDGDTIAFLDADGVRVACFKTADIYACSKAPCPAAPCT